LQEIVVPMPAWWASCLIIPGFPFGAPVFSLVRAGFARIGHSKPTQPGIN
jgi:hypothetical protein